MGEFASLSYGQGKAIGGIATAVMEQDNTSMILNDRARSRLDRIAPKQLHPDQTIVMRTWDRLPCGSFKCWGIQMVGSRFEAQKVHSIIYAYPIALHKIKIACAARRGVDDPGKNTQGVCRLVYYWI